MFLITKWYTCVDNASLLSHSRNIEMRLFLLTFLRLASFYLFTFITVSLNCISRRGITDGHFLRFLSSLQKLSRVIILIYIINSWVCESDFPSLWTQRKVYLFGQTMIRNRRELCKFPVLLQITLTSNLLLQCYCCSSAVAFGGLECYLV